MRRLRLIRFSLLLFLGAFAAWILADIWLGREAEPPPSTPPEIPAAPPSFPKAEVSSDTETFQFVQERGGTVVTRLSAGRMLGMEEGHRVLSDIVIEVRPEPDKDPDRLVRVKGANGHFDASEHVVVLEGEVECDEVYVVAGHKGQPQAVVKKDARDVGVG